MSSYRANPQTNLPHSIPLFWMGRVAALPGEPDNRIIAGHRDGPFGRLRSAQPGDVVEVFDRSGIVRYRIDSAQAA